MNVEQMKEKLLKDALRSNPNLNIYAFCSRNGMDFVKALNISGRNSIKYEVIVVNSPGRFRRKELCDQLITFFEKQGYGTGNGVPSVTMYDGFCPGARRDKQTSMLGQARRTANTMYYLPKGLRLSSAKVNGIWTWFVALSDDEHLRGQLSPRQNLEAIVIRAREVDETINEPKGLPTMLGPLKTVPRQTIIDTLRQLSDSEKIDLLKESFEKSEDSDTEDPS